MNARETVIEIANRVGVDPNIALSLWQQESGQSTDTGLLGQQLSRNRGRAVGPFQVVPYYHPDFPIGGSFADQAEYALNYLKDVGIRGYYGEGNAPAGHPTTDQYEAQVLARAGGQPSVQPAVARTAVPDAQAPAEPKTMTPFDNLMNQLSGQQAPQVAQPNFWLTAAGNMDPMAPGFSGIAQGLAAAEKQRYEADLEQAKLTTLTPYQQVQVAGLATQRERLQQMRAIAAARTDDPDVARLVLLGGMDDRLDDLVGMPGGDDVKYGVQPHYESEGGETYVVRYGNDGTKIREKATGTPFTVEKQSPEFLREVARAKAEGKAGAESDAEFVANFPGINDQGVSILGVLDDMLADEEGMKNAVGMSSLFPTVPGSKAADYERKLGQVKGEIFLQAYERLKGAGQITEVEGAKAEQALSDLALDQSEAAHVQSLKTFRTQVLKALNRARKRAGMELLEDEVEEEETGALPEGYSIRRVK